MPNTNQHSHLKSTRPWPFQATTGGFATIDHRHAGDTPQGSAYGSNSPKPPTKTSHTTPTNRRRHAEHDQHCHLKDPPAHRRATTPPSTQPPRHTATQAPTVSSIIPAARTKSRHTRHATPQKRLTTNQRAQTVVHYTPHTPCHPDFTEVDCTLSNHTGDLQPYTPPRARDAGPSKQPRGVLRP